MTSIEWLEQQIQNNIHHTIKIPTEYIEQAKEMHKAEILAAFTEGASDGYYGESDSNREKYYEETFKKELTSQLPGININDVKPSNPQMIKENFSPKSK